MLKICYYHGADLDGHCSGAIFRKVYNLLQNNLWSAFSELKLIPYSYNDKIDIDKLQGNDVYFLDCSPQPVEEWLEPLIGVTNSLTIIDHHKSFLENPLYLKAVEENRIYTGSRIGIGACALTWEYWKDALGPMPLSVKLLAEYDAWLDEDKDAWDNLILPYQYGIRLHKTNPVQKESVHIWDTLLDPLHLQFDPSVSIDKIRIDGKAILKYEKSRLGRLAKSCSFEATLSGMRALCVNSCSKSSMSLERMFDPDKHDLMLVYNQVPNEDHTLSILVSLYTTKKDIDCSKIAKAYGGGGHAQAAGFKTKSLDWVNGEVVFNI